jgi:menaquinone-9 beta-reductase
MTIAATLPLPAAGARVWDTIMIGAGPAGALAARQLALAGFSVLLIDRAAFPRWKVCGACLNSATLATLAAVGLDRLVEQHGAIPLHEMQLAACRQQARVPLVGQVSLSREAFDAALVKAAVDAGASFLPRTWARLLGASATARHVALRQDGGEGLAAARVVIAADGLSSANEASPIVQRASRIGAGAVAEHAPAAYRAGTIFMACGGGGYVGLVRIEDGRLNIAAALDAGAVRRHGSIGLLAAAILAEGGLPAVPDIGQLCWRGTPALTRRTVRPAAERLFLVGDAAGYVEPFTGEGIAWALGGAIAVARVAGRACRRWDPALAAEWSACYRRTVACRQWPCRMLAALLRRPLLTGAAVALLHRVPLLLTAVLHILEASAVRVRPHAASPG